MCESKWSGLLVQTNGCLQLSTITVVSTDVFTILEVTNGSYHSSVLMFTSLELVMVAILGHCGKY